MRTEADELCPSCRNAPWGNGLTVEEMLDSLYDDDRFLEFREEKGDDGINAMLFATLVEAGHCTTCCGMILDRLPSWMRIR